MEANLPNPYGLNEGYMWYPTPVDWFEEMPETVQAGETELEKKSGFHVSLFELPHLAESIAAKTGISVEEAQEEIVRTFVSYVAEKPIVFRGFLNDFRIAEKEERKSVVVRCEMENLDGFFETLEKRYSISLYRQPAHVTIYTLGHNKGIGIHTTEEMEQLPEIELPAVFAVLGGYS
ncbi:hypothetical protein KKD81_03510 [Patescibacteria group bacterium]|nr:hypothetical protein [Patescibacteria group bacterium]MBU2158823.1 hypothetical protein [Patescibacteria group bacterium]MBU2220971.1 hypothetical protein [Patescibacteria group bacterium]